MMTRRNESRHRWLLIGALGLVLRAGFASGMPQTNPQTAAPAPSTDAEIAAKEKELEDLKLKKQIEELEKKRAILLGQTPQQTPAAVSAPASPAKATTASAQQSCPPAAKSEPDDSGWGSRIKKVAQKQIDKAGTKIGKASGGAVDGSVLPNVNDITGATQNSTACPPAKANHTGGPK